MQQFSSPKFLSYNTFGQRFLAFESRRKSCLFLIFDSNQDHVLLIFEPGRKQCFLTFDLDQDHYFSTLNAKVDRHRKCFFDLWQTNTQTYLISYDPPYSRGNISKNKENYFTESITTKKTWRYFSYSSIIIWFVFCMDIHHTNDEISHPHQLVDHFCCPIVSIRFVLSFRFCFFYRPFRHLLFTKSSYGNTCLLVLDNTKNESR